MASLHAKGWRQGSVFSAALPLTYVVVAEDGTPAARSSPHGRWVVVSQDCDLDGTDEAESEATVELRPIFVDEPPEDWGIRSGKLLVAEGEYLVASSPRVTVSAHVLSTLLDGGDIAHREPSTDRKLALKTWLGVRYDRPAVPTELVPLATRISREVRARRFRETAGRTRDVLMQFDDSGTPPRFSLFAVLERAEDEDEVRTWLSEAALAVPRTLGVADEIRAAPASEISLHLIETSYAADVSQVTWRSNQPGPDGAT
jgi:hypothetical protein